MSKLQKWTLRASSVWTAYVWSVLIRNMLKDREHSLRFRLVHIGLGLVSSTFAVLVWRAASAPRE